MREEQLQKNSNAMLERLQKQILEEQEREKEKEQAANAHLSNASFLSDMR